MKLKEREKRAREEDREERPVKKRREASNSDPQDPQLLPEVQVPLETQVPRESQVPQSAQVPQVLPGAEVQQVPLEVLLDESNPASPQPPTDIQQVPQSPPGAEVPHEVQAPLEEEDLQVPPQVLTEEPQVPQVLPLTTLDGVSPPGLKRSATPPSHKGWQPQVRGVQGPTIKSKSKHVLIQQVHQQVPRFHRRSSPDRFHMLPKAHMRHKLQLRNKPT